MNKHKVYYLSDMLNNQHFVFFPYVDNDTIKLVNKYHTLEPHEINIISEKYINLQFIQSDTIIKIANIENESITDFKKYIYTLTDINQNKQHIYIKTNNTSDINNYQYRIKIDKIDFNSDIIEEPLGFYYLNNTGKKLLKCDITKNILLQLTLMQKS